jgi:hypothetical protein
VSLRGTSSAPSTLNSLVRKLWSIRRQSNDTRLRIISSSTSRFADVANKLLDHVTPICCSLGTEFRYVSFPSPASPGTVLVHKFDVKKENIRHN